MYMCVLAKRGPFLGSGAIRIRFHLLVSFFVIGWPQILYQQTAKKGKGRREKKNVNSPEKNIMLLKFVPGESKGALNLSGKVW